MAAARRGAGPALGAAFCSLGAHSAVVPALVPTWVERAGTGVLAVTTTGSTSVVALVACVLLAACAHLLGLRARTRPVEVETVPQELPA